MNSVLPYGQCLLYSYFPELIYISVAKVTVMPFRLQGQGDALLENLHTFG
jgi:hypothetical protein